MNKKENYNILEPIKFYCQKVLPLVYDDSLSYYELLCKVVDYLNNTINEVNTNYKNIEELYNIITQLKEYVNNYFENLDIQKEVNTKIEELIIDGRLNISLNSISVTYFGAVGDGETDDTKAIQSAINYCQDHSYALSFDGTKIYKISNLIITQPISMNGNMCTLLGGSVIFDNPQNDTETTFKNFIIDMNYTSDVGIHAKNLWRCLFEGLIIKNPNRLGWAIKTGVLIGANNTTGGNTFTNIRCIGNRNSPCGCIYNYGSDNTYNDIDFKFFNYGILNYANIRLSNIHGFVYDAVNYDGSYFINNQGPLMGENLYPDTQENVFIFNEIYPVVINNVDLFFNEDVTPTENATIIKFGTKYGGKRITINNFMNRATTGYSNIFNNNEYSGITINGWQSLHYPLPNWVIKPTLDNNLINTQANLLFNGSSGYICGYTRKTSDLEVGDTIFNIDGNIGIILGELSYIELPIGYIDSDDKPVINGWCHCEKRNYTIKILGITSNGSDITNVFFNSIPVMKNNRQS